MFDIKNILIHGVNNGASDIHIIEGSKPIFRINRVLTEQQDASVLTHEDVEGIFEFFIKVNESFILSKCSRIAS